MGLVGCPETSVSNYQRWVRNNSEDRSPLLLSTCSISKFCPREVILSFMSIFQTYETVVSCAGILKVCFCQRCSSSSSSSTAEMLTVNS